MSNIRKIIFLNEISAEQVQQYIRKQAVSIPALNKIHNGFLALKDDEIIGISGLWLNDFHPNREHVFVYMNPSERRNGIGTQLYQSLEEISELNKFQTAFDSSDKGINAFVKSVGFSLARETWEYSVELNDFKPDFMNLRESEKIKTLSELSADQFNRLVHQHLDDYRQNHLSVNSLKDISVTEWKEVFCDEMLPFDSFVFLDEGKIKCYMISYESDEDAIFIGYTGTLLSEKETKGFLSYCVKSLFEKYRNLELEIDSTDKTALFLFDLITEKISDPWVTYIKDIYP